MRRLTRTWLHAALCLTFGASFSATVFAANDAVRVPTRLTAGASDQFLGTLAPGGQTLYFVSNRNATAQLFAKNMQSGREWLVFDDGADVSFPRVSPDGKRVLYVSSREDAGGDVCVRHLETDQRRCFTGAGTSEVQAFWFPDGKSIAVLGRKGLHGDLRLRRVPIGLLSSTGETIVEDNLSGPALSPDGRWLAWLPIRRASAAVGISFAMKATGGLALRKVVGGKIHRLTFNLPGVTGFAAFSRDGRWLYFTQYLSDTSFDGRIDGDDHAVLFRARFHPHKQSPVDVHNPVQLTSARANCQYPQPARDRLVMTCATGKTLDVFTMPLDGAVPAGWRLPKLKEAIAASRDRSEQLMLLSHQLRLCKTRAARREVMAEIVRLHLVLGEHASADFYAARIGKESDDKDAKRWAVVARELIAFQRDARLLNRGELNDRFLKIQRTRLWKLAVTAKGASADVQSLARLTMMQIHDVIGEERRAMTALAGLSAKKVKDRFTLLLIAGAAVDFLRQAGRNKRAESLLLTLCQHPRLTDWDRIDLTGRLLRTSAAGQSPSARAKRAAQFRPKVAADSEAAFRLELEAALLQLAPNNAEDVRKTLFKQYRYHREFPRRQTLIAETMKAAARVNSGYLMYQFANTWVSMVSRKHAERPHATQLFRQVVLERAYIDWNKRNFRDARGHFYGVTLQVDALEAHVGFIEMREREGKKDALKIYEKRYAKTPNHPVWHFIRAYVGGRSLAQLPRSERMSAIRAARGHLRAAASKLATSPLLHHLRGFLAHQAFLLSGDNKLALAAHNHYLLALDLASGNPRCRATTLHALGLLQAAVGNHHLAIDYFDERRRLPLLQPLAKLSLMIARARSLFHIGKLRAAVHVAESALTFVRATPALTRFEPLVVDRAGMYAWRAQQPDRALRHYEQLIRLASKDSKAHQMRAQMMAGAAAMAAGSPQAATRHLDAANQLLDTLSDEDFAAHKPKWRKTPPVAANELHVLNDGLLAQALVAAKDIKRAEAAMSRREAQLQDKLANKESDATLLALALTLHDHAAVKRQRHDHDGAAELLERALRLTKRHAQRTGTLNHRVRAKVALAYAALHLYGNVSKSQQRADPRKALASVYAAMCRRPNPARAAERFVMKMYLSMLRIERDKHATLAPSGG